MILVITYVAGDGRYNWDVLVTFFVDDRNERFKDDIRTEEIQLYLRELSF